MAETQKREIALFPNQFLFMQDLMTGRIQTHVGPTTVNPGAQDRPVLFDHKKGNFRQVDSPEAAVQQWPFVPEGFYMQLLNPAVDEKAPNPDPGKKSNEVPLRMGRKVNIAGPISFALWPGQHAKVIRGHQPRSNQYLLIRVYNAAEAEKHWKDAQIQGPDGSKKEQKAPSEMAEGDLFIIKGTEVSFYIPPTGIQVVPENGEENYVREALTLERMEYCILVDENGNKRYERGPQVVFPAPTEKFITVTGKDNSVLRKFGAIELTKLQGLHIMVTADYDEEIPGEFFETEVDEEGKKVKKNLPKTISRKAGEEIFITGKATQIYFPRAEHRVVTYDGNQKHFATAIPAGEGRYVLKRLSGHVPMIKGPEMYLPDPREEVFVRRALTDKQCEWWYPGNKEVAEYNQKLRDLASKAPTTRAGAVSEGEILRSMGIQPKGGGRALLGAESFAVSAPAYMEKSAQNSLMAMSLADESIRSSTYSAPRSLTLNTKLEGVPTIAPYTGFAVMVVSKSTNKRRVVVGPANILLEYDEELEVLALSTGKPKNADEVYRTPYLRTNSNKVSDIIDVQTKDHVQMTLKFSLNVDFEGDPNKWFSIQNYVKVLTDHVRSILKSQIRKLPIEEFHLTSTDIIRDVLLGKAPADGQKRPYPLLFQENGMRVTDVDVLNVEIKDNNIAGLLTQSAIQTVKQNIEISTEKQKLETLKAKEQISRETAEEQARTALAKNEIEIEKEKSNLDLATVRSDIQKTLETEQKEVLALREANVTFTLEQVIDRDNKRETQKLSIAEKTQSQKISFIEAETKAIVEKVKATQGGFNETVAALHNAGTLERVAEALSVQTLLGGKSLVETVTNIFGDTPIARMLAAAMERATSSLPAPANGKPGTRVPSAQG